MSARPDLETVCDGAMAILKAGLNTKLTAIGSEKNDGITCKPINDNAYFFQDLNNALTNFDPFVLYGGSITGTKADFGRASQDMTIYFLIVFADNGVAATSRIATRYLRALKETFEESWNLVNNGIKLEIINLDVIDLEALNSSTPYKCAGINLTASIG